MGEEGTKTRRFRPLNRLMLVASLAIVATVVLARNIRSPAEELAASAPPPPSTLTSEVRSGALVDALVIRGRFVPRAQTDLILPGPAVVTAVGVQPGDVVVEGQVLASLEERPVILLEAEVPFYRDLFVGDSGPDVGRLRQSLARLGLLESGSSQDFDLPTATAVGALYERSGYAPLPLPEVHQEQVAAASNELDAARGRAGSDGGESVAIRRGNDRDVIAARQRLEEVRGREQGPWLSRAEFFVADGLPRSVTLSNLRVGQPVEGVALSLSAVELIVEAEVAERDRADLHIGETVEVVAESVDRTMNGVVESIGTQPDQAEGSDSALAVVISLPPTEAVLDLVDQAARVEVPRARTDDEVSIVSLSAISVSPEDRTFAERLRPDGSTERVEVRLGLIVGNEAEIEWSSPSLEPGDLLVITPGDS